MNEFTKKDIKEFQIPKIYQIFMKNEKGEEKILFCVCEPYFISKIISSQDEFNVEYGEKMKKIRFSPYLIKEIEIRNGVVVFGSIKENGVISRDHETLKKTKSNFGMIAIHKYDNDKKTSNFIDSGEEITTKRERGYFKRAYEWFFGN